MVRFLLNNRCNRPERLLLGTFHVSANLCDNSRFKEAASKLMTTAASDNLAALRHCIFHMLLHLQPNKQFYITYCMEIHPSTASKANLNQLLLLHPFLSSDFIIPLSQLIRRCVRKLELAQPKMQLGCQ